LRDFEFGLDTVAQVTVDESGQPLQGDQVIRNTIEEAVLADSVGIDSFNIGEHYRPEFMDSAGPRAAGGGHRGVRCHRLHPTPRVLRRADHADPPLAGDGPRSLRAPLAELDLEKVRRDVESHLLPIEVARNAAGKDGCEVWCGSQVQGRARWRG
jgi:hypothetical protein